MLYYKTYLSASSPRKLMAKTLKCRWSWELMVKLPAVGFMQATYCTLWISLWGSVLVCGCSPGAIGKITMWRMWMKILHIPFQPISSLYYIYGRPTQHMIKCFTMSIWLMYGSENFSCIAWYSTYVAWNFASMCTPNRHVITQTALYCKPFINITAT